MKLTENQKEFLLNYFFKNEQFAGWRNIATTLLEDGSCIVAGESCIWQGGIGNFITSKEAENTYNCVVYSFDLSYFLSSAFFKDIHKQYVEILAQEKQEIVKKYNEISEL